MKNTLPVHNWLYSNFSSLSISLYFLGLLFVSIVLLLKGLFYKLQVGRLGVYELKSLNITLQPVIHGTSLN